MKKLALVMAFCCTSVFAASQDQAQQSPKSSDSWAWSVAQKFGRQAWEKKTDLHGIEELKALCLAPNAYGNQKAPKKFELECKNEYTKWRVVGHVNYGLSNTNNMNLDYSSDKGDGVELGFARGQASDVYTCKEVQQFKYNSSKTFDAFCEDFQEGGAFENARNLGQVCYGYYQQNAEQVFYSETALEGTKHNRCESPAAAPSEPVQEAPVTKWTVKDDNED